MKKIVCIFSVFLISLACKSFIDGDPETFLYPKAATVNVVDDYLGTKITDPYRWLEDPDHPKLEPGLKRKTKSPSDSLRRLLNEKVSKNG